MEITKQNLYRSVEELGRIYMDHMRNYYGRRSVQVKMKLPEGPQPLGMELPELAFENQPFDFSILEKIPVSIQLDVGASSYWSEIACQQTLDNLLMQGKIELVDYLERIPNGYITKKQELIEKIKGLQQAQASAAGPVLDTNQEIPIPTGRGNGALQRSVMETGVR